MSAVSTGSSSRPLVVTGVHLADGTGTDLAIVDGRFVEVSDAPSDAERIDAGGLIALPGLVDLHAHLREPGREDAETVESGTRAAARGGYTAVFAMPNLTPTTDTAEAAQYVADLGRRDGSCEVVPIGAVTKGREGHELAELGLMAATGVRVFSDDGACVSDSLLMRRALTYLKPYDGVVAQHAQDPRLAGPGACAHESEISGRLGLGGWPTVAESTIIARDVMLAEFTGGRYHACHLSTAESVDVIRWAKKRGINVTAEVTPHHLLLTDEYVRSYDPVFKVNPPLRTAADVEAVRQGLEDGTIDIVATDHAPHADEDKDCEWAAGANGMLGLETALSVVQSTMVDTGRLTWADVARVMSTKPAEIGRVTDQGRPLAVGEPANVTLVDPRATRVIDRESLASKARNTPYHGMELPGRVVATFLRGRATVLAGALTG